LARNTRECHSERSEESCMDSNNFREILRFAQNDREHQIGKLFNYGS